MDLRVRGEHGQLRTREPEEGAAPGAQRLAVGQRLERAVEARGPLELGDQVAKVGEPAPAPELVQVEQPALPAVVGEHALDDVVRHRLEERAAGASSPASTTGRRQILRFTSWSERSTPAELSMASVLMRPPASAKAIRARCVKPRFPPSATARPRSASASTRTASFAGSPTSACVSAAALT